MAVNRSTYLAQLPAQVKSVNDALVEVCKVVTTGANPTFDIDQVWGAAAADNIKTYVGGLAINADLTNTVKTVKGAAAGAAIMNAINTGVGGLETVIHEILDKVEAAANPAMLQALTDLLHAHDPGTYGTAPFGLVPAIAGIITSGGGDANALTGPLNEIADAGTKVTAMLAFADFADATLVLLKKALSPA